MLGGETVADSSGAASAASRAVEKAAAEKAAAEKAAAEKAGAEKATARGVREGSVLDIYFRASQCHTAVVVEIDEVRRARARSNALLSTPP